MNYRIGVIGCGRRMSSLVDKLLSDHKDFSITAIADPRVEDMKKQFEDQEIAFYADARDMLNNEKLDGVMIGTRCSLHTPMALLVKETGLPLFLEKPVATSYEQLDALKAMLPMSDQVVVSFPLRACTIAVRVKEIVDSGVLGKVQHVEAVNNVYYGRGYYHKWYRDDHETGGLFLQKATHDFDYINFILGNEQPVRICAMNSKQIFKGDMPQGQKCEDCPRQEECPESVKNVMSYGEPNPGDFCCFAKDTGNEDSGSAIVRYASGMHVVYTQNFVVRKGAGKRGARFIGYKGTLEFDFKSGVINVYHHNENKCDQEQTPGREGHHGGDFALLQNFADVVRGKDVSHATLAQGILSAEMCLAARKSAENDEFVDIRPV